MSPSVARWILPLVVTVGSAGLPSVASAGTKHYARRHVSSFTAPATAESRQSTGLRAHTMEPAGELQYYGGHIISRVQVVVVLWGSNVDSDIATGVGGFFSAIVASPYMDMLGEYDTVGMNGQQDGKPGSNQHLYRGTYLKTVTIQPSSSSNSILDMDVQTELQAQIAAGTLPAPVVDPVEGGVNTLYFVYFPPGLTIDDGSGADSCSSFCAYHSTMSMSGVSSGVPYAIMPDVSQGPCTQGCGVVDTVLERSTLISSHEFAEAITDTEVGIATNTTVFRPLAWYNGTSTDTSNNSEVGDICDTGDQTENTQVKGYTVQKLWSQLQNVCAGTNPSLTVCNGTNRPCTPCSAGACSGATPICDQAPTSPTPGQCVACSTNADCTTPEAPLCDTTTRTCRGCSKDADCSGVTPRCNTATMACVGCFANTDCTSPSTPTCDATTSVCRGCRSNADCSSPNLCNAQTGTCGTCGADQDCSGSSDPSSSGSVTGSTGGGGGVGGSSSEEGAGSNEDAFSGGVKGCAIAPADGSSALGGLGLGGLAGFFVMVGTRRRSRRHRARL